MSSDNLDWQELELAPTLDRKAVKKAYAKKLKMTSPEKDPEGFKRLRSAYEQVLKKLIESDTERHLETELADNSQNTEIEKPVNSGCLNFTKEILRCLNYSFEMQAIAYLNDMSEGGELDSLHLRQTVGNSVIDYLYNVETNEKWPTDFVDFFVEIFEMNHLAKQDRQVSQYLDYFNIRKVCKENGWSKRDYADYQKIPEKVNEVLISIRATLFDEGESESIEILDKFIRQGLFDNKYFITEFRYRFLNELNQYFPSTFPFILSEKIEACLNLSSVKGNESLQQALNNLEARKKAFLEVKEYKEFYTEYPASSKALCYKVMLGEYTLYRNLTKKTPYIYKEIKSFIDKIDSFSEAAKNYELIKGKDLEEVKDWLVFIESINRKNFKKDLIELNNYFNKIKRMAAILVVFSIISGSYVFMSSQGLLSSLKKNEALTYFSYWATPVIALLFFLVCSYHIYERYLFPLRGEIKHRISINEKLNWKISIYLLFVSLIFALLSKNWDFGLIYIVFQFVISFLFLLFVMAVLLVVLPFFPSFIINLAIEDETSSEYFLIIYTITTWLMYFSFLWLKNTAYKIKPGESHSLLGIWTAVTVLYSLAAYMVIKL